MTSSAKKPLTLGELVRVDAELTIKWDLELPQNTDVYRGITPDYAEEIDFDRAKDYLLKKGHSVNEAESALRPYFETNEKSIIVSNEELNFDEALLILKGQKTLFDEIEEKKLREKQKEKNSHLIYKGIKETGDWLLYRLKGTGIELKFKSLIYNDDVNGKDEADVIIRGWKYFVAVHVTIPNSNGYSMGFAPWYVQIINFNLGEANPLFPLNSDRGSWLFPSSSEMASKIKIDPFLIYTCCNSPYYFKIFHHLVQLGSDAISAVINMAIGAGRERERLGTEAASSLTRMLNSTENIERKVDKWHI